MLDGGLVNPVPVSACRALGADVVIAVNLNAQLVGRHLSRAGREEVLEAWQGRIHGDAPDGRRVTSGSTSSLPVDRSVKVSSPPLPQRRRG